MKVKLKEKLTCILAVLLIISMMAVSVSADDAGYTDGDAGMYPAEDSGGYDTGYTDEYGGGYDDGYNGEYVDGYIDEYGDGYYDEYSDTGSDYYIDEYGNMIPLNDGTDENGIEPYSEEPEGTVIASIDGYGTYYTLKEAFDSAYYYTGDQPVRLMADIVLTNPVDIKYDSYKEVTLDLNGYVIRMYDARENMAGDVSGSNPDDYIGYGGGIILNNGKLTVTDKSEWKQGRIESSNDSNPIFTLIRDDYNGTYLYIDQGEYKASDNQGNIISLKDSQQTPLDSSYSSYDEGTKLAVVITGGKYNKMLPASYIAAGYSLVDNGDGTWSVVEAPETYYNISWVNWDGTWLETDSVKAGDTPVYYGAAPERPEDEQYTYTFAGWDSEVVPAAADVTYTAVFTATEKSVYYNVGWLNWDGTILETDSVKAGDTPVYYGAAPERPEDEQYIYVFAGWDREIAPAAENTTYTAVFTATEKDVYYDISWVNWDGTLLETDSVKAGDTPVYYGATPERPEDEQYIYVFAGWDREIAPAAEDTTYTAVFTATEKDVYYDISWVNWDGTLLETDQVKAGDIPIYYGATPRRHTDNNYRYEFAGWDKAVLPASNNEVYTARYNAYSIVRVYTIVWQNYDNSVIYTEQVRAGVTPSYKGSTPYRASDGKYSYVFAGWLQRIVPAWCDAVYTAVFNAVPIVTQYTIVWQNYDGTVLETDTVNNGELPVYNGAEPTRASDGQYTYEFVGWDKTVSAANSNAVYVATFKAVPVLENGTMGVYTLNAEKYEENVPVIFEKGKNEVPYIELSKAFDILNSLCGNDEIGVTAGYNGSGREITLTGERENGASVIISLAGNTITFSDYKKFTEYDIASDTAAAGGIELIESNNASAETELCISLEDYGLNVYRIENQIYIPLETFSDLFMVPAGYNWIYNGTDSLIARGKIDDSLKDRFPQTVTARTADQAAFDYNELCLMLDVEYGMKKDLNVKDGFDIFFRSAGLYEGLTSENISVYEAALKDLSSVYFQNRDDNEKVNAYEEAGETAYITIADFVDTDIDLASDEIRNNLAGYIESDTRALIVYAAQQITREGSPVKNVVIDISDTHGYSLKAVAYVMSWLKGTADICTMDVISENYSAETMQADIDLDGTFTETDRLNSDNYNVYCLISDKTTDSGNLLACGLKSSGKVQLVGQTTGGGAYNKLNKITATGYVLEFSGLNEFMTVKAGSHISTASGAEPDVYVKNISSLSNRDELNSILQGIK